MNTRSILRTARRRPAGAVVATLCLLLAPWCQALCVVDASSMPAPVALDAGAEVAPHAMADCHGAMPSMAVGVPDDTEDDGDTDRPVRVGDEAGAACCADHAPTPPGAERVDAPPAAVASAFSPSLPLPAPSVRAPARADPAAHGQGPPLRLLTQRFTE